MSESTQSTLTGFLLALAVTVTASLSGRLYYDHVQANALLAAEMPLQTERVACR